MRKRRSRSYTDRVSAIANDVWLSLRMIGSDASRGTKRRTTLVLKIRKRLLMSTGQVWQGGVWSHPRGRDFVVASFFEGETDGFDFEAGADGFQTN
jgi:hypothetical protein